MNITEKDADVDIRSDDRLLISRLVENDNSAWRYVKEDIVDPLVQANVKGVRDLLLKHSIPLESVSGKVYEGLRVREWEALRNFRFECRFKSFLYWRIYDAVQRLVRETSVVPDPNPIPIGSDVSGGEDGEGPKMDPEAPDETIRGILIKEAVAMANRALAKLWESNPAYALVLLMRNDLKLPSQEVGLILNRQPNTVDQMNIRAQKALRTIRDDINADKDVSFYPSEVL